MATYRDWEMLMSGMDSLNRGIATAGQMKRADKQQDIENEMQQQLMGIRKQEAGARDRQYTYEQAKAQMLEAEEEQTKRFQAGVQTSYANWENQWRKNNPGREPTDIDMTFGVRKAVIENIKLIPPAQVYKQMGGLLTTGTSIANTGMRTDASRYGADVGADASRYGADVRADTALQNQMARLKSDDANRASREKIASDKERARFEYQRIQNENDEKIARILQGEKDNSGRAKLINMATINMHNANIKAAISKLEDAVNETEVADAKGSLAKAQRDLKEYLDSIDQDNQQQTTPSLNAEQRGPAVRPNLVKPLRVGPFNVTPE